MKVAVISDIHANKQAFEAALEAIASSDATEVWCLGDLVDVVELGQIPDALTGRPLGVVVLHRVDQLAHEARREVDARDDDPRHLDVVHLVIDARERHGELVVGVADVREVRVVAGHDLRREVDVDVALWRVRIVHVRLV